MSYFRLIYQVSGGRLVTDPDLGHICQGRPRAVAFAENVLNESKEEVRRTGKRPRVAYRDVLADVQDRFADEADEVQGAIGHFGKSRTSFYRAYNKKFPVIPTLADLEQNEEMQLATDGNPWILALNVGRGLLMLATDQDLALLHRSDHWVEDGNFDFQPKGFVQLYTIHGFLAGECKAAVHILMSDRRQDTYTLVLTVIRDALRNRHQTIGAIQGNTS